MYIPGQPPRAAGGTQNLKKIGTLTWQSFEPCTHADLPPKILMILIFVDD
jgi:hypothetical protein